MSQPRMSYNREITEELSRLRQVMEHQGDAAGLHQIAHELITFRRALHDTYASLGEIWARISIEEDHPRRMISSLLSIQRFLRPYAARSFEPPA